MTLMLTLVLHWSVGSAASPPSIEQRKEKIQAHDVNPSAEALARKRRSETVLRAEHVPISNTLPVIETEAEAKHRAKEEIAHRALALLVVSMKGEGVEQPIVEEIVASHGLAEHFSPAERAFIRDPSPSEQDRNQFSWRYESAWTLLWALGYIEQLGKPTAPCDVKRAVGFMQERTAQKFVADAKLRPLGEILDQADRIYRYHWAVVDARVNDEPTPAGLDPDVTMERHYALNWLIGYMGQDWDDISTDT